MPRGETLDMFESAYGDLVRAGTGSLSAAYRFGAVIDALHGHYTLKVLAGYIDRSPAMVGSYRKLFLKYPNENALQRTAEQMQTYDIQRLNGSIPAAPVRYVFLCMNCGSTDIGKHREAEILAGAQREQAALS